MPLQASPKAARSSSFSSANSLNSLQTISSLHNLAHSLSKSVSTPTPISKEDDNLHTIFEALALKERKVLEARELLDSAISELQSFKTKYKPVLGSDLEPCSSQSTSSDYFFHSKTHSTISNFSSLDSASSLATTPPISPQTINPFLYEKSDNPSSSSANPQNDPLLAISPLLHSPICFHQLGSSPSLFQPSIGIMNRFPFRHSMSKSVISTDLRATAAYQASVREMAQRLENSLATVDDKIEELEDQLQSDRHLLLKKFEDNDKTSVNNMTSNSMIIKHMDKLPNEWNEDISYNPSISEYDNGDEDNTLKVKKSKSLEVENTFFTTPKKNNTTNTPKNNWGSNEYPVYQHESYFEGCENEYEDEVSSSSEESQNDSLLSNFSTFFKTRLGIVEEKQSVEQTALCLRPSRSWSPSKLKLTPMDGFKTSSGYNKTTLQSQQADTNDQRKNRAIFTSKPIATGTVGSSDAAFKQDSPGGSHFKLTPCSSPAKHRDSLRARSVSPKRTHVPSYMHLSNHSRVQSCTMPNGPDILQEGSISPGPVGTTPRNTLNFKTNAQQTEEIQLCNKNNNNNDNADANTSREIRETVSKNEAVSQKVPCLSKLELPISPSHQTLFTNSCKGSPNTTDRSSAMSPTRISRRSLQFIYSPQLQDGDDEFGYISRANSSTNHSSSNMNRSMNVYGTSSNSGNSNSKASQQHYHHWQHHGRESLPLQLYDQYVRKNSNFVQGGNRLHEEEEGEGEGEKEKEQEKSKCEILLKNVPVLSPP